MIQLVSDIFFGVFAVGYLPTFFSKLKQAEDPKRLLRERWGEVDFSRFPKNKPRIWLHAVSVGEVKAIEPFYHLLSQKYEVFLSTVTPTGQSQAKKLAGERAFYFPFDWSGPTRRSLQAVKPDLILLTETEIWPNFINSAAELNIPTVVINGRLSERSLGRYELIRGFISKVLNLISFFLMQTEEDEARLLKLGVPREKMLVLGNMKFDSKRDASVPKPLELRSHLGIARDKRIWVAGSTHPGEERPLMNIFTRLRSVFPSLILILAPRHIERAGEIMSLGREFNYKTVLLSEQKKKAENFDLLIVDTIGELKRLYSIADVVFLGGSFIQHGGQNPIEPALYARPIFSGPHVFNFSFVYKELEKAGGVRLVGSEDELFMGIKEFLIDGEKAIVTGDHARRTVERLAGASERTFNQIQKILR